jgi:hypothetical protein
MCVAVGEGRGAHYSMYIRSVAYVLITGVFPIQSYTWSLLIAVIYPNTRGWSGVGSDRRSQWRSEEWAVGEKS